MRLLTARIARSRGRAGAFPQSRRLRRVTTREWRRPPASSPTVHHRLDAARPLGDHRVVPRAPPRLLRCRACVDLDSAVVFSDVPGNNVFTSCPDPFDAGSAAPDHSRRRATRPSSRTPFPPCRARYERRDDRYRDDRRDREWYVPRDHHRLARGRNRSVLHDRWLRRFHATIDDGVPRISRRHETGATRTETFATFIADFSFPPTFPVHPSPQGPEGRR